MSKGAVHRPRARFSQHFLQDRAIIARLVEVIDPKPGETVVEIGPGLGALTEPLLERLGRLDVVEIDTRLVAALRRRFSGIEGLRIHHADALTFDFASLASETPGLRVVGNLPYHISTPLLFHLFAHSPILADMHFMLQRELVQRLVSPPGSRRYGRLSVTVQYHCRVEKLFDVKPEAFRPVPRVASTVIRLTPHSEPPVPLASLSAFESLVARAFAQRRKTLRNSLKGWLNEDQIRAANVDPGTRPETLDLADFAELANLLHRKPASSQGAPRHPAEG